MKCESPPLLQYCSVVVFGAVIRFSSPALLAEIPDLDLVVFIRTVFGRFYMDIPSGIAVT
jgi:hypothetical protein